MKFSFKIIFLQWVEIAVSCRCSKVSTVCSLRRSNAKQPPLLIKCFQLSVYTTELSEKNPHSFHSSLFALFTTPVSEALHVQSRVKPGNGPRFAVRFFPQRQSYPLFCTTICHFHYIYAVSQKKGTLLCCHNLYSKYVIEHTTVVTFYVSFCGLPIA